jgi:type VI secretion system protein ImpL
LNDALASLTPWMPWILAGLGLLALVVLGVIAWILLGNTVPEEVPPLPEVHPPDLSSPPWNFPGFGASPEGALPGLPLPEGGLSSAGASAGALAAGTFLTGSRRMGGVLSPLRIRQAMRSGYRALRAYAPKRTLQMGEPWILAIGPDGSGKRELLDGLPIPRVLPHLAEGAVGWFVFDQGVVLDVPETLLDGGDERGWETFLSALVRVRPERPADGVVLVLPASLFFDPVGRDPEGREVEALAAQIFQRFQRAQAVLGLRFPVHVLIHGLEAVPGFRAIEPHLPEKMRDDIFGWASPFPLESAYQPGWVGDAFREIRQRLGVLTTEILATRAVGVEALDVFRFSERLGDLEGRTSLLLDTLFRDTAYHEGFFLRGIHFSARPAADPSPSGNRTSSPPPALFTAKLFKQKIFPERGLATVFRSGLLDRNLRVRALQMASAFFLLIGIPGIYVGAHRLGESTTAVREVLQSLEQSIEQMRLIQQDPSLSISATGVDDSVFAALAQMADLNRRDFRALALPDSWFRPLDPMIDQTLRLGLQEVVIPILRTSLLEWADSLQLAPRARPVHLGAGFQQRDPGTGTAGSIAAPLVTYLVQIDSLVQNIGNYNAVASTEALEPFEELVKWYFELPLPAGFKTRGSFVRRALAEARDEPIRAEDRPEFNEAVLVQSLALVEGVYGDLLERVEAIDLALSVITAARSDFLADDLLRLVDDMAQLERFLDRSGTYWLNPNLPLGDEIDSVVGRIPDAGIFSGSLFALQFRRDFERIRATRLMELSQLPSFSRVLGPLPLSATDEDTGLRASPALEALASGIRLLGAQRFMAPLEVPGQPAAALSPETPQFGALPRWSARPLEEVVRLLLGARTFETATLEQFPPALQGAVRDVIAQAIEARVREGVSAAMIWERAPEPANRRELDRELGIRVENFEESARLLIQIMELDEGPGGSRTLTPILAQVMMTEVLDLLQQADRILEESRPYQSDFSRWRGGAPANVTALGLPAPNGIDEYLTQQREIIQSLATRHVSRIVAYASLPPLDQQVRFGGAALGTAALDRLSRWQGILRTLDQFEAQEPGNALAELERYIRVDLQAADASQCPAYAPAATPISSNYFLLARQRLDRGFRQRCTELARLQIESLYSDLRTHFQGTLAGRAPFVSPDALYTAPEADRFAVVELIRRYNALTAALGSEPSQLLRALPDEEESSRFLRDLGALIPVLSRVFMESDPGAGGLGVRLDFRTHRAFERGGDQLVEWSALLGSDTIRLGEGSDGRTLTWRTGDPVSVRFRWASGSPRRPLPARGGTLLDPLRIEFRHTGPWALLRLIAASTPSQEALRSVGLSGSILEPGTLLFAVPTGMGSGGDPASTTSGPAEMALLFVRIRLLDPASGQPLELPRFPVEAPALRFRDP